MRGSLIYYLRMITYPPEVQEALILGQDRFVWETPSFEKPVRGPRWYVGVLVVTLFFLAYAIWTANFLFAFLILLLAIILMLSSSQEPRRTLVQIGDHGIVWGGKFIPFQNVDTFALIYEPPVTKVLYIEPHSVFVPRLRILLEEQDPIAIRNHLKQYVNEDLDLQSEHLSDMFARLLRI